MKLCKPLENYSSNIAGGGGGDKPQKHKIQNMRS